MSARPRKALGQHFLSHAPLLDKIAAVTGAGPLDVVLEIGPGRGALTRALLDRGAMVVAIERDQRLIDDLVRRFSGRDVAIVAGDALELDWRALVAPWVGKESPSDATGPVDAGPTRRRAPPRSPLPVSGSAMVGAGGGNSGEQRQATWRVAGNIPYNITSPLLAIALSPPLPASITFLVQRELADRVAAAPGSRVYGALSIGVQAVADVTRAFTVSAGAFSPRPQVDSAVLHLVPKPVPLIAPHDIAPFRRFVTSIFSYRRKRGGRALAQALSVSLEQAEGIMRDAAVDPDARPETLDVQAFVRLYRRTFAER